MSKPLTNIGPYNWNLSQWKEIITSTLMDKNVVGARRDRERLLIDLVTNYDVNNPMIVERDILLQNYRKITQSRFYPRLVKVPKSLQDYLGNVAYAPLIKPDVLVHYALKQARFYPRIPMRFGRYIYFISEVNPVQGFITVSTAHSLWAFMAGHVKEFIVYEGDLLPKSGYKLEGLSATDTHAGILSPIKPSSWEQPITFSKVLV